eukprot:551331-Lingulodinium_polyedra.AAC.1
MCQLRRQVLPQCSQGQRAPYNQASLWPEYAAGVPLPLGCRACNLPAALGGRRIRRRVVPAPHGQKGETARLANDPPQRPVQDAVELR